MFNEVDDGEWDITGLGTMRGLAPTPAVTHANQEKGSLGGR